MGNLGHLTWTRLQQLQEQCNPIVPVCAVFLCVQTMVCSIFMCLNNGMAASIQLFLTCTQMLMHATVHRSNCTQKFQGHKALYPILPVCAIFSCVQNNRVWLYSIFMCPKQWCMLCSIFMWPKQYQAVQYLGFVTCEQMLMHVTEHKEFQGHKAPPNPTGMCSIFMCPEQMVFGFTVFSCVQNNGVCCAAFSCVQTTVCDCTDVNGTQRF